MGQDHQKGSKIIGNCECLPARSYGENEWAHREIDEGSVVRYDLYLSSWLLLLLYRISSISPPLLIEWHSCKQY